MGKVVATYLVKVTLRELDDLPLEEWREKNNVGIDPAPTIKRLVDTIEGGLYDELDYFTADAINVTAERTDR